MRFLIIGAGGLGGYFGARLVQAGQDVTFLLRDRRAGQIAQNGLVVRSPMGDVTLRDIQTVSRAELSARGADATPFDVVIVGCKAYDLDDTMASFAPAVGPDTMILPVLNGFSHVQVLQQRFGAANVIGGYCMISAALDGEGNVIHYNKGHKLAFGEWDGPVTPRVQALADAMSGGNFESVLSTRIQGEMWEKWVQIATLAGMTCLMRGAVGTIIQSGGELFVSTLLDECLSIARANGQTPTEATVKRIHAVATDPESPMTASMCKDLERGGQVEADHLIGDLIARRPAGAASPTMLDVVFLHLKTYERRRAAV